MNILRLFHLTCQMLPLYLGKSKKSFSTLLFTHTLKHSVVASPWLHYTVTKCTEHAKVMRSTNRVLLKFVISNSFRPRPRGTGHLRRTRRCTQFCDSSLVAYNTCFTWLGKGGGVNKQLKILISPE